MKILVVQLSDAAHLLLTTPLLRGLKKSLPHAELHLLARHNVAGVLAPNRYIDTLHHLHFSAHTTIAELRGAAFNHVLPLNDDAESASLVQELNAPVVPPQKGFKTFWQRLWQRHAKKHPAEAYLQKAASLSLVNDRAGLDYFIPRAALVPYTDLPASHLAGFIALAVSGPAFEMWPVPFFQQLLKNIDHPVVLIGSPQDRPLAERIAAVDDIKVYNACGKFTLHETADLVRKAKLLVAYDPYFVQTAAALDKKLVWLMDAATSHLPPYYRPALDPQKEGPFDAVKLPPALLVQDGVKPWESSGAKFTDAVVAVIRRRLKQDA